MRAIHPTYKPIVVTCVGCGTKIETRSTKGKDFNVDVCSHCHPFYTGRQKFVDSAGRVERFQKKWAKRGPKGEAKAAAAPAGEAALSADSGTAAPKAAAAPAGEAALSADSGTAPKAPAQETPTSEEKK